MGQPELAMAEAKFIAKDAIDEKNLKPSAVTGVETEFSIKRTSTRLRKIHSMQELVWLTASVMAFICNNLWLPTSNRSMNLH